ncbi:MAG TPA: HipA domain-containing protein, partial [Bacteroidota bacterium]|nr:HipA domain-containing protein [Bacteroidota bacterium]
RAAKMSIQGIQPKLSVILKVAHESFEIVDTGGNYILKPQTHYTLAPENEDLTMRLAHRAGIDVPLHALIHSKGGTLSYLIKRFDRSGERERLPVEDFAQLLGRTRDTKYDASMEQVASVIDRFATFPALEKLKLFRRTLFNFLVGNEDMHLKNFSLIRREGKIELSPAYDLLNSTILLGNATEEIALPLGGKKRNLSRRLLVEYFGSERLGLSKISIEEVLQDLQNALKTWEALIEQSFLSESMKIKYAELVLNRRHTLEL